MIWDHDAWALNCEYSYIPQYPKKRDLGMYRIFFGIFLYSAIFQIFAIWVCTTFKMEYSKNFKQK